MANTKVRIVRGDFWAEVLQQELLHAGTGAAEWMEEHTRIVKSDDHTLSGLLRLDGAVCFLKLYRYRSVLQHWLTGVGMGRPLRNFAAARELDAQGLAVPRPLACLRVSQGILLLVEGLSRGGNLNDMWPRGVGGDLASRMLRAAGDTLATLHQAGYAHGDCSWSNLYWDGSRVFLVNLADARKCDVGGKDQNRDLARFTVSAEQVGVGSEPYEEFMAAYLDRTGGTRRDMREGMLRPLLRLRKKHLAHSRPQGQPLL